MASYVVGHSIPDSDSICGAISLAHLKSELGEDCYPARNGDLNPESAFILKKFGIAAPELKKSFANEQVYLVDHSDLSQSPEDIKSATILGIVDHHKLGDITTDSPLECWIRPVGCSNTIIKQMYDYYDVEIPVQIAGIMLCAILSDTVIFKSPTCTNEDKKAAKELAKIAGIDDYKALGMEMFKVKSDIENATPKELVFRDYKDFDMSGKKIGVGQLEVVDLSLFDDKKEALFKELKSIKNESNRDSVLLLLTDIMEEGSLLLAVSEDEGIIEGALGAKLENGEAWLPKVLSRKKQVIPFLERAFGKK
ncbi:MAG: manganese-dependent inorganic pyrophosphatase [Sulfurospirillaceae bacterium]|nr:manganese-dependent inorganic pyrophosphatase [Sulfurospirillaceae bacterium]MCK9545754.1 manganese-dependent inorganic pyrophosphatase [Sulfurospirillaceae bacterium]MDY0238112.1 manganese-dependent inorganic pyrophosphatase [Campylobacterales bacterium]NLN00175.1 manganese-dependent inorganic pyrophosphatase [Campylobacteraceae bacterium]